MCLISGDTKSSLLLLASFNEVKFLCCPLVNWHLCFLYHVIILLLDCKIKKGRAVFAHHCFPVSNTWFDLYWKLKKYLLIHAELVSLALLQTGCVILD